MSWCHGTVVPGTGVDKDTGTVLWTFRWYGLTRYRHRPVQTKGLLSLLYKYNSNNGS